jgi:hypothetical protein
MAKQVNTPVASLAATKRAAKSPSKAKVVKVQADAAPVADAAPAPAPAPTAAVPVRGGAKITAVRLTDKAYRSAAAHNTDWWAKVTAACGKDSATVATLVDKGVPAHFIGYTVRRGYLTQV